MNHIADFSSTVLAAFLASLVEFVEALTVVLAVGSTRGWRSALAGVVAGLGVLTLLVALLGRSLRLIPLHAFQWLVGALLILFGMRWLRKAILRAGGAIPLHDEEAAFARTSLRLGTTARAASWDGIAFVTACQIVLLEGSEVVFILLAISAGSRALLLPAVCGALVALLVVVLVGFGLRRPLLRVPENTLKFAVGVLLTSFGTFWFGEGIGLRWPGGDIALLVLVGANTALALGTAALCRRLFASARVHARGRRISG